MRKILTIGLLSAITYSANAQYTYGEPVDNNSYNQPKRQRTAKPDQGIGRSLADLRKTRIGLFIAPLNSWMKPTASKSNDGLYLVDNGGSKVGYSWGIMIDHFFAENYGIATGAQLTTTGGIINAQHDIAKLPNPAVANTVKTADINYRLQYFEVPFGLKLLSDPFAGGLRVFGNLGITAGINIGKKGTYTITSTKTDITTPTGIADTTITGEDEKLRGGLAITPIMFQMNLGAGIEYQLTNKMSFYMGLFFNNGFAPDVTNPKELKLDYDGSFTDGVIRLNNMALKVGLYF